MLTVSVWSTFGIVSASWRGVAVQYELCLLLWDGVGVSVRVVLAKRRIGSWVEMGGVRSGT